MTIYIDPSAGVNGSGTFGSPKNTWAGIIFAYGETYLQKEGTSYTGNLPVWNATGAASETNRIVIGTYRAADGVMLEDGEFDLRLVAGAIPGQWEVVAFPGSPARARVVGDTLTHMIDIAAKTHVTVDGLELTGNPKTSGFFAAVKNGSSVSDGHMIIRHCWVHHVTGSANNSGIYLFGNHNDVLSNIVHDVNEDGIYIAATSTGGTGFQGKVSGNRVWSCSKANETTSGNGDCIQLTGNMLGGRVTGNHLDHTNADCKQCLNQSTGTTGSTVLIEGNYCKAFSGATANKGIYVEHPATIRYNRVEGGLHTISVPAGSECSGNLVINDSAASDAIGIQNGGAGNAIKHNTVLCTSVSHGTNNRGISHFDAAHTGCAIRNNIVSGFKYGIRYHPGAFPTESNNDLYDNDNPVVDNLYAALAAGVGTILSDPGLDSLYRPANAAVFRAGATLGGLDYYGRSFPPSPTIGAVQRQYLPTHPSRDAVRTGQERHVGIAAELDLDRCTNAYGVSPCTAGRTHTGTAQAGAASTLTLAAGASAVDDTYAAMWARIHTGAGAAQERRITDYVGSTKVATVHRPWSVNLLQRSEEIDNAFWTKTDASVTANVTTAPDGTVSGDKLQTTTVTNPNAYSSNITATAQRYAASVYLKAGNIDVAVLQLYQNSIGTVNQIAAILSGPGSVTSGSATEIVVSGLSATEWTRVQLVSDAAVTPGNLNLYLKNRITGAVVGDYLYFWGAQLEPGTAATDYIKTTSAAVNPPDNTSQYHIINRPGACYNTRATCQDKANFTRGTKTYKFGLRGAAIPPGETVRPYISRADAAVSIIDPEAGLARRNTLKLDLVDETDSDREQDPYVDDRASAAQGTFWGRLIARNPNMAGRLVRVRRGFVVEPWDWNTFLDELYLIDRVDGPGRDGAVAITLKDPVKLTDRTKIPVPTDGKLTAEIKAYAWRGTAAGGTSTTVVLGQDASSADDAYNGMECYLSAGQGAGQRRTITDYVGETRTATVAAWVVDPSATTTAEVSALSITLASGKGSQYADPGTSGKREFVRIGEEIIEYTAKSTDTLSWPTGEYRAQFGTSRADHSKDAQVQLCRAFIAQPVTTVVRKLLEEGGLSASYIDTTSLTDAEGEWYGEAFNATTCLSEPEAPNDLLAELLPQIDAVVWWSPQTQKAVFKVLLPTLGSPGGWGDAGNFIEASVDVETLEELRLTYAAIYYGRGSGTANRREAKNYTLGEIFVDTDAEAAAEYGDRRSEVVYSRWFGAGNQIAMRAWVGRRLAARRDAPRRIRARLDPKDYDIPAGEFKDITTRRLVDAAGAPKATRCLVTKVEDRGTHIEVEARTTGFAKRYGFIAPNGTADHPTDTTYAHISQNTGLMSDGSEGYLII